MGGEKVSVLVEFNELAKYVCDNICKYPEQYDCQDIDKDFEKMYEEQCKNCPIMELVD